MAVVADDEMLDQDLEFSRESGDLFEFCLEHFQFDNHVSKQLPARRVGKRAIVGELVDLTDIMKKCAREQEITVDLWIVAANQIAGAEQGHHVIQQTTDIGMVKCLGGGRVPVSFGYFRVCHEGFDEGLQIRIFKTSDEARKSLPKFADVLGGFWQVIGEVYF